jgi:hypothetical protein
MAWLRIAEEVNVSDLTVMNRWRRYQVARLEGLLDGLLYEARRLPDSSFEPEIHRLGNAMRQSLNAHCDDVRSIIHRQAVEGQPLSMPELRFESL